MEESRSVSRLKGRLADEELMGLTPIERDELADIIKKRIAANSI